MSVKNFVNSKKVGAILRVFAQKEEQIPDRIKMIEEAIERLLSIRLEGQQAIKMIDVMVWADKRYSDSDCGKTAQVLRDNFGGHSGVFINEVEKGDLFCSLLNYGREQQTRRGCHYSMIVSSDAFSYITSETIQAMFEAADKGALATGVAITELTESILEGRLANTFCMWDNIALGTVGGFDLKASKPINERTAHYLRGWSGEAGEVYYQLAGVEEIIPLAQLVDHFGPCIAPVLPQGEGIKRYQVPDREKDPQLWERHWKKMGTKLQRQTALLTSVGFDPSHLMGGVMPEYRQF
jgi:hypothetical protein